MKVLKVMWIPVLLLGACSLMPGEEVQPRSLLTPFVTQTPLIRAVESEIVDEVLTPTPTLTPTPFAHVLGINETVSSLALTYGLEIADILAINPEITPNALSVGTQILIPGVGGADAAESEVFNVISEPLALDVTQAECVNTAEGGLWCAAEVLNPLEQSAAGITVTFALKNSAGETEREQTVPTLLNLLEAGESIPVTAYFSPTIPAVYSVDVGLTTALPAEKSAHGYLPVDIKVNSVDADGRTASVSAVILPLDEKSDVDSVWVVLIAYDLDGIIVGVRRLEYSPAAVSEEGQAVKVFVYSNSENINQVNVLGEAVVQAQ